MKLLKYEKDNKIKLGVNFEDKVISLDNFELSRRFDTLMDFVINHSTEDIEKIKGLDVVRNNIDKLNSIKILKPFDKLNHDVICVGLNYEKHIEESKNYKSSFELAPNATYFSKRSTIISGPNDDILVDDEYNSTLDYENELALIIGKEGKNISEKDALEYIFGFTILNDFSSRDLQSKHGQWFKGKSLDGYTSIGPVISHISNFSFPLELSIVTKVNGEIRQSSNTKYMIRNIQRLIYELSNNMTLFPGDIIATGTPDGVGMGFTPTKFLQSGDLLECFIENIGTLKNNIKWRLK